MNYIKHLFSSLFFVLIAIGTFNWFIDPFGMFWSPQIEGLNSKKIEAGTRSRITKDYAIRAQKPEIVLIGNSRIEMGLNPNSSTFHGQAVYNIGLPGLGLQSQWQKAYEQLTENNHLSQLIISIDYLDFLYSPQTLQQPEPPTFLGFNSTNRSLAQDIENKLPLLLSLDASFSSILTILRQSGNASAITSQGFNTATSFIDTVRVEGKGVLFKQKLVELSKRLKNKGFKQVNTQWQAIDRNFSALIELVSLAKEKNVEVVIFISPYHVTYLHLLHDLGYWLDFLAWKTRVANHFGTVSVVYDFSGLNPFTAEAINLEHPKVEMQWFWEPAHYKQALGEKMLPILLKKSNLEATTSQSNIARLLTPSSIDNVLVSDQKGLEAFAAEWQLLKAHLGI